MSRFVTLYNDTVINLDHVTTITSMRVDGETVYIFDMTNGDTVRGRTSDDVEELNVTIIPAFPGFDAVRLWQPGKDDEFLDRDPVIGWRVLSDGVVLGPVTPDSDTDVAVLYPDGRVVRLGDRQWRSLDEWMAAQRAAAAEKE